MELSPAFVERMILIIAGVVAAGATAWLRAWLGSRAEKKKADDREEALQAKLDPEKTLEARLELLRLVSDVRVQARASRALVLVASNSGKIPIPGEEWHGTVIEESVLPGLPSVKRSFRDADLDEPYLKMLQSLIAREVEHFESAELPRGMLKDIYERTGVLHSTVIMLTAELGAIYYLSLTYKVDANPLLEDHEKLGQVQFTASKIESLLKEYEEIRVAQRRRLPLR